MDLSSSGTGILPSTTSSVDGSTHFDGSAALSCPSPLPADPTLPMRTSCSFAAGDLPGKTIGITETERMSIPIKHIIVVMKENRSFDHLFGNIHAVQPDAETFPADYFNKDLFGTKVYPFHYGNTCYHKDPDHSWDSMHKQVNGGKMDGYVTEAAIPTLTDGHFTVGYFDQTDFPFYNFLAGTFSLADHYFSSVRGPTYPNRDYLVLATSDQVTETQPIIYPNPDLPSIFDRLTAAGVSWGVYAQPHPFEEALNNPLHDWETMNPSKLTNPYFFNDVAAGTLPSVVYVDSQPNQEDDHPYSDVQDGEAWLKRVYDAVSASPMWASTAILLTYDEAGGFFDHMPPPNTCPPSADASNFFELGTRVPMMVISPWARRHYVSKVVHEHTSIVRFIETVYGLPALTNRDANSDALLDMFDFNCSPQPIPAAPASGTGHCLLKQDMGVDGGVQDLSTHDL